MIAYLKDLLNKGVTVPILKDPVTKKPSITFTTVVISFIIAAVALSKTLGKDLSFSDALSLYVASSFLYLGRKFQNTGGKVEQSGDQ